MKERVFDTLNICQFLWTRHIIHYTQQADALTGYKKENNFNNYYIDNLLIFR